MSRVETVVDLAEFARFFLTGVIATIGNLSAVWFAREVAPLTVALLLGLLAGFTISFVMSKFYAFRSRELARTPEEMLRFILVYGIGAGVYYGVGLALAQTMPQELLPPRLAELFGAFCGASLMMVTSYLGHRFFTYRRGRAAGVDLPAGDQGARDPGGRAHRTPKA